MLKYFQHSVEKVEGSLLDNLSNWELVPDEDLWEDGELTRIKVINKIIEKVFNKGEWLLIRRKNDN
jgi:hypothetical protein